jgi:hypothetical protein
MAYVPAKMTTPIQMTGSSWSQAPMPSDIFDEDVAAHKWSFARILELGPVGAFTVFLKRIVSR